MVISTTYPLRHTSRESSDASLSELDSVIKDICDDDPSVNQVCFIYLWLQKYCPLMSWGRTYILYPRSTPASIPSTICMWGTPATYDCLVLYMYLGMTCGSLVLGLRTLGNYPTVPSSGAVRVEGKRDLGSAVFTLSQELLRGRSTYESCGSHHEGPAAQQR